MLVQGRGGAKQVAAGLQLSERACHDGDQAACGDLAVAYLKGDLAPLDCSRLHSLAEAACDHSEATGCAALGAMYWEGVCVTADQAKSSTYVMRACDAEDASSCRNLGRSYELGEGVTKDVPKAIAAFEHACRLTDFESCVSAGVDLLGEGDASNAARGLALLDRACDHEQAAGCAWQGIARRDGLGAAPDLPRARKLFETACAAGSEMGCISLVEQQVLHDELDAAMPVAERLCKKSVTPPADFHVTPLSDVSNWITGCRQVGEILLKKSLSTGQGADANAREKSAFDALQGECGKGRAEACYALGLWFDGLTDTPVAAKARHFYEAACHRGFQAGCFERQRMSKGVSFSFDPHVSPP